MHTQGLPRSEGDRAVNDAHFGFNFDLIASISCLCGLHRITPAHVLTCRVPPRVLVTYGHRVTVNLIYTMLVDAGFVAQKEQLTETEDGAPARIDIVITDTNGRERLWVEVALVASWHEVDMREAAM